MADRGTYRAIKVVLLDGPDFQELPERARWVFLTLKMSLGPSGIEMHYPEALVHNISARTGADPDDVRSSLGVLEEHGWIIREGNVIWIAGQLKHDPGLKAENPKHRASIQKHVAGLPRLRIVRSFIDAHPEFFPPDEYTHPNGYPEPSDSHSIAYPKESDSLSVRQIPNTKDRIPSTEEREPKRAPAREDSPAGGGSLSGSDSPGSVGAHRDPEPSDSHSIAYPKKSDSLSVHQRPKTKDQIPNTEEEAAAAARPREGPIGEMEADLARFLEPLPDARTRRRVEAQARMVLTGDDRKAWETDQGTTVPEDERPELFRLALGYHADGSQKSFRSSVRYAVKLYAANERAPPDPRMGRAERKLAERIAKLQSVDLSTAFQS